MSELNDQKQLESALQTVQRLYMKLHKKKECVEFYVKHIQPIYAEFEANEANKEQDKALNKHSVSFSEERAEVCDHKFDADGAPCRKCGKTVSELLG